MKCQPVNQAPTQRFRDNRMVRDIDLGNNYLRASRMNQYNTSVPIHEQTVIEHQRQPTQETSFF